jgi:NADPH:quinone reductase-like Zn-dependent oxidoreductase
VRDLLRAVTPRGTLVLSGGGVSTGGSILGPMGQHIGGMLVRRFVGQRVLELPASPTRKRLETIRGLAEAGALRAVIDRTYPLAEAAQAIRYLEVEHARAKVVLTVAHHS